MSEDQRTKAFARQDALDKPAYMVYQSNYGHSSN